ncbi:hypothetical protein Tco_0397286 [Tanacetum coccineum]
MQTRSSSKFVGEPSTNPTSTNPKRRNRRRSKQRVESFSLEETPVVTMANQRTMAELLRTPTEGHAEAIVVILRFEKEDPHAHIRYFNKITSTLKYKDVPESSIKLMLFPFSIDGPAQIWLDKEPPRSILTWDDLVSNEAWDRFKDLLRACPHHGFTELHQLDTFYNGLNPSDQDSLNSAAGGNLLERSAQDVLKIIENKSKVRNSRNKPIVSQVKTSNVDSSEIASVVASVVTSAMTAMFKQHQVTPAPASVKAVEESCVTCGGAHSYRQCPATDGNKFSVYHDNIQGYVLAAAVNYNQGNTGYRPPSVANQTRPSGFAQPYEQNNQNWYNQATMSNQTNDLKNMMASFFQMNTASSSGSGSTRSGIVLDGPSVPMPPPFINPEEDERAKETLTDPELVEYTIKVPPPLVQKSQALSQKFYAMPKRDPLHPNIPYPSRMNKEKQ